MNHDRFAHYFRVSTVPLNEEAVPLHSAQPAATPSLVACIIHPSLISAAQGIYQLAYENALATTRVSRFELATKACLN
jgi:hypothetical protein